MNKYDQQQKAVMAAIREYVETLPTYQNKADAIQKINVFIASLLHDVIHEHVDKEIESIKGQIQGQQKQTLYDWSDSRIPEWANWLVTDKNGETWPASHEPSISPNGYEWHPKNEDKYWKWRVGKQFIYLWSQRFDDWKQSKEARPK